MILISKHFNKQPIIMIIAKMHPIRFACLWQCLHIFFCVTILCILMSKLRNSSVQRNIDPTDQLISAETIQFPAMEEELGGIQYTVHSIHWHWHWPLEGDHKQWRPGSGTIMAMIMWLHNTNTYHTSYSNSISLFNIIDNS